MVIVLTVIVFIVIQLPPGDFMTSYVQQKEMEGITVTENEIINLERQYGLDQPLHIQYWKWITGIITEGDFGRSFQFNAPVEDVIGERLFATLTISILSLIVVWGISIPVGIYSAVRQYSVMDYIFTFIAFVGMATPTFLLALVLIYVVFETTGLNLTGLYSSEFKGEPMSIGKFFNMLPRLILPILILAVSATAGMIRVTRSMVLDELRKQYVITARAKGLSEKKLLFKYPVRVAINPLISTIGWTLPGLIGGETILSIVLNLPTTGPMLLDALQLQDMYLAGSFLLIVTILTLIGTLISDIALAWLDPRIRFGGVG
jgi:peptide/nickel transport system permease protein